VPYVIPAIPGLQEELERGITCLDVGCGSGTALMLLASRFPRSKFYGVDSAEECVIAGKNRALEKSLSNVDFVVGDANELPKEWASKFGYVTSFIAIHDMARPDLALREIFRVLGNGGRFLMIEMLASSNVFGNVNDKKASFCYTLSLYHCVPTSLYFPDGFGVGSMWGVEKTTNMLKETGFGKVEVMDAPWDKEKINAHYLCTKTA